LKRKINGRENELTKKEKKILRKREKMAYKNGFHEERKWLPRKREDMYFVVEVKMA